MNIKDFIQKREEEFDKLGGEELLEYYSTELPDGHLTRGFDFPESAREIDPEKVKHFHRQSIIQFTEMIRYWVNKRCEENINATGTDKWNSDLEDLIEKLK